MKRHLLIVATLAFAASGAFAQSKATSELNVAPFKATYSVEYRGIRAGTLDFALRESGNKFIYESIAHPRGLARIVVNNNLREATEFILEGGVIVPRSYELDDGSRSTSDDTRLTFDWSTLKAIGTHEDKPIELALSAGIQDRMSAQVAVIQGLAAGKLPEKISFIDRNEIKEYTYKREREEKLKTPLGDLDTVVVQSSRPGSSRVSRLWYAPSLGYVPVRGEQERKGKVETVFAIESLERRK